MVQGLATPGMMASDSSEALVSVWAGPTVQLGSVPLGDYLVRVDDPVLGSTFTLNQPGIYQVTATVALPTDPTAGLLVAAGLDHTATQRSGAEGNPEPWWPQNNDNGFWSTWPGGSVQPIKSKGPLYVSQAMAADPSRGVLRVLLTDVGGAPPTPFHTVPAIASLRVARISAAGE